MRQHASTKTWRLLAIDDNRDSAELIARAAAQCGYEGHYVLSANAVRESVERYTPDVVTLDLGMPDADGIEILLELADMPFSGHLIIVSGQPRLERERAMQVARTRGIRASDHFAKPVPLHALRNALIAIRNAQAA